MKTKPPTKVVLGAAVAFSLALGVGGGPAKADYAPSGTDVVSVGGDTPQLVLDFGADGDVLGDLGYNAANNVNKLVNIDATADGNGRAAYAQGSTSASPLLLNPTTVFRAGTNPVQRIPSTGAGISALIADTGTVHRINFVRIATPLTAAQNTQAIAATNVGHTHTVQLGTDGVELVASNTTNAPAGLSVQELLGIYASLPTPDINGRTHYTHWNELPGNAGGSANTIIPLIPPSTSAINKALVADLKVANGGTAPTLGASVLTVEQNDPGALTGASSPVDAIAPFSTGRLNVWNTPGGYFKNPNTPFPGGATVSPGIKSLTATAPDTSPAWSSTNGIYVVFRQSDVGSTAPFQPGSTKNWVQALFFDPSGSPFFSKAAAQSLLAAAGITPGYADKGQDFTVG